MRKGLMKEIMIVALVSAATTIATRMLLGW